MQSVAIVGANLAGGRAALALRAGGFDGAIHLIGGEAHPPYERPPLSKQLLLGEQGVADTFIVPDGKWDELDITLHCSTWVEQIDPTSQEVHFASGSLRADKILLCTGGNARRLSLPGVTLEGVEYLRTIEDALRIRQRLVDGGPVVVVGGGFVGAEVAASARRLGCDVTIIEMEAVPLARVLGQDMGSILTRAHVDHGVRVLTGTTVARIEGVESVSQVVTSAGQRIDATLVVVGVGIEPA